MRKHQVFIPGGMMIRALESVVVQTISVKEDDE